MATINEQSDPAKTGPYSFLADVIINADKNEQRGQLRFLRDKERSRLDLQFGDYHETQVRDHNKLYVYRSTRRPIIVPSRLLGIERLWKVELPLRMKLSDVTHKSHERLPLKCFSVKEPEWQNFETRYCADARDNTLMDVRSDFERITLAHFVKLGEGYLPSVVIYKEKDAKEVRVRQIQLTALTPGDSTFAPPEHAHEFETCDYIEGGRLLKRVDPVYPHLVHSGAATIYFRGIVQKDGSFTDIDVFSPDGPEFEKSGLAAATQWKFSPPTCDGHPVAGEAETVITLQRN